MKDSIKEKQIHQRSGLYQHRGISTPFRAEIHSLRHWMCIPSWGVNASSLHHLTSLSFHTSTCEPSPISALNTARAVCTALN